MDARTAVLAPVEEIEGLEAQLMCWLKRIGELVELDEPLLELETEKARVEVAAPVAGVLVETLKGERQAISPGELLGWISVARHGGTPGDAAPERFEQNDVAAPDAAIAHPRVERERNGGG
jgi:2-oxoglutarate dehydrogenase E2 component (dihydrolipoamide succinyltransferase)